MPDYPGSQAGLPTGDAIERTAALDGRAPDPAWIAAIANSLFKVVPGDAMTGAGASLPSAPIYAIEPVIAQIPGVPASAPPVSPNLTPGATGAPGPGASTASVPVHGYEPLTKLGTPTPAEAIPPSGEKGSPSPVVVPPLPYASAPDFPGAGAPTGFLSEADLAAVPGTLGGAMAIIPPLNGSTPYGAPLPGAAGAPAATASSVSPPSPGANAPAAPVYAFEPLNYAGSPAAASFAQAPGTPQQRDAGGYRGEPLAAYGPGGTPAPGPRGANPPSPSGTNPTGVRTTNPPDLGVTNPGESYYFLDEGLGASTRATPLPYGWTGQPLDLGSLPSQHRPELALPPISGARQFDAHAFRRDFPNLPEYVNGKPLIWLDNAATTQKPQAVIDRLAHFYAQENSNVHRAAHALAARSTDAFEAAREKVRRFINAPTDDSIVWVRGTTEAINLVAKAWGGRNVQEGDEVVVTHLEHHSNIVPWQMLCAEKGAKLRVAPVDDRGDVLLDEYEKLLNPKTRIVAFTQVSNALGTITPAREMIEMAHRHGARVLVDGAQAVCHMPVDVQALDVDFYVFSGHKVFGPTGVGALYGKMTELEAMPPWQGGGSMIRDVTFEKSNFQDPPEKFEAGTGTIADAVGLGAAIDYVEKIGMANIAAYEHGLLNYALEGLRTVPGLTLVGSPRERAGAISFVLDEWRVEDVGVALNREGIAVRAGHHCAQPILRRFGYETTVRPSFALYNTPEDVDALVAALHRLSAERGKRGL
jgi:cysteine desulfurase/selenocysteine lyase